MAILHIARHRRPVKLENILCRIHSDHRIFNPPTGTRIKLRADTTGYPKVGDPLLPPHVHAPSVQVVVTGEELAAKSHINLDIPGIELRLSVDRIAEVDLPRDVSWTSSRSLPNSAGNSHPPTLGQLFR